ncbi:uncharacterized protein LAJ45_10110 [Morchella importuna]|uniref:uncharacterized protein n=1 Tax=Morchella importuna TaxID=1174673 RepID=UPI001E8CC628|nr:uncharacterized protein LAJ45_10110 [Morchella importuna]KAH8145968.1 hypothetical protein LAJ45_10110 [Morchella importuna]
MTWPAFLDLSGSDLEIRVPAVPMKVLGPIGAAGDSRCATLIQLRVAPCVNTDSEAVPIFIGGAPDLDVLPAVNVERGKPYDGIGDVLQRRREVNGLQGYRVQLGGRDEQLNSFLSLPHWKSGCFFCTASQVAPPE